MRSQPYSPDGCLPPNECQRRVHQKRRQRKKKPPASILCVTLFFAYAFTPSNTNCLPHNGQSASFWGPCQSTKSERRGRCFTSIFAVRAFSTPQPRISRGHVNFRINRLQVASSPTDTDVSTTATRQELEKMTVKQLKSHIQENGIHIAKGQSSSLKLKKQIVDFIWSYQSENNGDDGSIGNPHNGRINGEVNGKANGKADDRGSETVNGDELNGKAAETATPTTLPPTKKKGKINKRTVSGTGMPPLPTASIDSETPYVLTPKDRIVLDVLNRFPPLHESIVNACADSDEIGDLPIEEITTENIEQCDLMALNYVKPTGIGEEDIRHAYHPMIANVSQSDMDVVFVGTASCTPGVTRGVSCTAIRLNWRSGKVNDRDDKKQQTRGEKKKSGSYVEERGPTGGTWIFDCGESTQLSVQRTSSIKPGKISKIFVTHCHGDHSFGLPGLLCLMGTDRDRDAPPVEIYAPEGLRMWLRAAIRYSVSRVVPPYRVHELMDVPMAPEWEQGHRRNGRYYFQLKRDVDVRGGNGGGEGKGKKQRTRWGMQGLAGEDPLSWISRAPMLNLEASKDFGEIEGGRDIYPKYDHPQSSDCGAPIWEVEDEDDVTVRAAPMSHGVPCVGYVIRESDRPGRLRPEAVLPVIERNREGLKEKGVRNPMKVMAMVKNLPEGGSYEFPDGTLLRQDDVVEPMRRGRKVVVCGDTADCRALEGLAQDADVLVHEATNTFLPGVDKDGSVRAVTRDAKIHGHSTPFMAGDFAKRINAKKLVLNHFSARYKGDQSIESMTIMTRMERQAMKASGLSEDSVAAAWDFMVLPVARND